jgi:hypothetical protein
MLLNVAAHNGSIQNLKVSKRKSHISYSVTNLTKATATKRSITQRLRHKTQQLLNVAAHNVAVTKRKCYKT